MSYAQNLRDLTPAERARLLAFIDRHEEVLTDPRFRTECGRELPLEAHRTRPLGGPNVKVIVLDGHVYHRTSSGTEATPGAAAGGSAPAAAHHGAGLGDPPHPLLHRA